VSDEELLRGGPADFAALYRRHVGAILAYLRRRCGDPEVAADLCAETWAAALDGRERFDPARGEVRGWIFGIAHRQLVTSQRTGVAEARQRVSRGLAALRARLEGRT
jgi:RNA polymerase sigma-70 factor (ECF subfamily)